MNTPCKCILLVAACGVAGFAWKLACSADLGASPNMLENVRAEETGEDEEGVSSSEAPERDTPRPGREFAESPSAPLLGIEELRAALRTLGKASIADSGELEAAMQPFLVPSGNLFAVVDLLRSGELADESYLSVEELGALRALAFGVFLSLAGPAPGLSTPLDGHALALAIFEALPLILEPARGHLVDTLVGLRDEQGAAVLDESFMAELERLRALHPELAELYDRLLAVLLEADGPESDALQALYAIDSSSPTLVGSALARWFSEDSSTALAWAEARADDPATTPEVRRAITTAVAQTAPVTDASRFLSERAQRDMLGEFLLVGGREGGMGALESDYWKLRILDDADPLARRMLVSGMSRTEPEELLAITSEDPASTVRSQAWITLTSSDTLQPTSSVLQRLRECQSTPSLSLDQGEILVAAGNFARKAAQRGDSALVGETKEFIQGIYRDRTQAEWVRRRALEKLKGLVSNDEFERLSAEW